MDSTTPLSEPPPGYAPVMDVTPEEPLPMTRIVVLNLSRQPLHQVSLMPPKEGDWRSFSAVAHTQFVAAGADQYFSTNISHPPGAPLQLQYFTEQTPGKFARRVVALTLLNPGDGVILTLHDTTLNWTAICRKVTRTFSTKLTKTCEGDLSLPVTQGEEDEEIVDAAEIKGISPTHIESRLCSDEKK